MERAAYMCILMQTGKVVRGVGEQCTLNHNGPHGQSLARGSATEGSKADLWQRHVDRGPPGGAVALSTWPVRLLGSSVGRATYNLQGVGAGKVGPAQIRQTDVTRYVSHIIHHATSKRA